MRRCSTSSNSTLRDIAPVAGLTQSRWSCCSIRRSRPDGSEPIGYAKSNPGKLKLALTDPAAPHASGELFRMMSGLDLAVVPTPAAGPLP